MGFEDIRENRKMIDSVRSYDRKDVLLVFPPLQEHIYGDLWKPTDNTSAPLGLLYLATPLIKAGYNLKLIDFTVDKLDRNEYFSALKRTSFILISCYTHTLRNVQKIIGDARNVNEKAFIICGGPYCNDTENHVEGSDLTVIGEADLVILDIIDTISSRQSLAGIPGLSYRSNGRIVRNPGRLLVKDLDLLPLPSFDLAKGKNYGYLYGQNVKPMAAIVSSRGCPFHCNFCTFRGIKYRERSVDQVIKEIKLHVDQGVKYLMFYDDNLLLRKERIYELGEKIIQNKFNLKIGIVSRIDMIDYDLFCKLREAGVILIIVGIESFNQDVLNFYNKGTTVERLKKSISIANDVGILTFGNIIIGAPMETDKHIEVNKKILREIPLDFLNVHILHYSYPSPLWQEAREKGLIMQNEIVVSANSKLCNFSKEELLQIQADLIRSFYRSPRKVLRLFRRVNKALGMSFLLKLLQMFIRKAMFRPAEKFHDVRISDVTIAVEDCS